MGYSRNQPSPRYNELIAQYRQMHIEGERFLGIPPDQTFPGKSLIPQADRIKRLIEATRSEAILDYGSGKGMQYGISPFVVAGVGQWPSIVEYWDISEVTCYDPCFEAFNHLPEGRFDGVICTDVLEHCPEEDIEWVIDEIFSYADKFVFANVACYPAAKRLPSGENAHCTIRPVEWWARLLKEVTSRHPQLQWEVWVQFKVPEAGGALIEERLAST